MRHIGIALLLASLVLSCTPRVIQKEKDPVEEHEGKSYDDWWDYADEMIGNLDRVEFYSKSPKDQLRYAKHAESDGDHKLALAVYGKLYHNESAEAPIRAEALFRLAKIYSNLIYTYRDYDKAAHLFEKLISEFPHSEFRAYAEESLKNIHKFSGKK